MTIDLSRCVDDAFRKAVQRAEQLRSAGQGKQAAAVYRHAAGLLRQLALYAVSPEESKRRLARAEELERLADQVARQKPPVQTPPEVSQRPAAKDDLQAQIDALVVRSPVQWDQIGGLEETKRQLKLAFGMALASKPPGVQLEVVRNVLLYGPPGTGKSLLAGAVSHGLQATFFNVPTSALLSKWFGESARLISTLFRTARQQAPSVVFLDELECLFRSRDASPSGGEHQVLSTLLVEIDGVRTSEQVGPVFVIGATNAPWLMDKAALSRFGRRVYVPLPDAAARKSILEIHLVRKGHQLEFPLDRLVGATEGLSGRQLAYLAAAAVEQMVAEANPDLPEAAAQGLAAQYQIKTRPLRWTDVEPLLAKIQPDTSPAELRRFQTWPSS
jgi:katanin p60 ATPase-containing subunit A1